MSGILRPAFAVGASLVALLAGVLASDTWADKDDLSVASRASGVGTPPATGFAPALSADGRFVAFRSRDPRLVGGSGDHVFVRDLRLHRTRSLGPAYGGRPAISGDGRIVAFIAEVTIPGQDATVNRRPRLVVRDLRTGSTTLPVGVPADGTPHDPTISADGRVVAFAWTTYEVGADGVPRGTHDIFIYDLRTRRASAVAGLPAGSVSNPALSADGRFLVVNRTWHEVVQQSAGGALRGGSEILVRDRRTATTTPASRLPDGASANAGPAAAISADGRFVAFDAYVDKTGADGLARGESHLFLRDLRSRQTVRIGSPAGGRDPSASGNEASPAVPWRQFDVSADGRFVAFLGSTRTGQRGVLVRDVRARKTVLASRAAGRDGAPGDGPSLTPALSADGRFVAFASWARNLGGAPGSVYVRDVRGDRTPPVITQLATARTRAAATLTFTLSEPATVSLTVQRVHAGDNTVVGRLTRAAVAGRNKLRISRTIGFKHRPRSHYRAVLTATDRAGNRSRRRAVVIPTGRTIGPEW